MLRTSITRGSGTRTSGAGGDGCTTGTGRSTRESGTMTSAMDRACSD